VSLAGDILLLNQGILFFQDLVHDFYEFFRFETLKTIQVPESLLRQLECVFSTLTHALHPSSLSVRVKSLTVVSAVESR
jgi:hypothetical protein